MRQARQACAKRKACKQSRLSVFAHIAMINPARHRGLRFPGRQCSQHGHGHRSSHPASQPTAKMPGDTLLTAAYQVPIFSAPAARVIHRSGPVDISTHRLRLPPLPEAPSQFCAWHPLRGIFLKKNSTPSRRQPQPPARIFSRHRQRNVGRWIFLRSPACAAHHRQPMAARFSPHRVESRKLTT